MKLEEYENFLQQEKNDKQTSQPVKKLFSNIIDVPVNPTSVQDLVSYEYRNSSSISGVDYLDDAEITLISNDCVRFINKIGRFKRLEKETITMLEVHVESFMSAYMYRWYPYMYPPEIKCKSLKKDFGYTLSVYLDNRFICDIGIGPYAML